MTKSHYARFCELAKRKHANCQIDKMPNDYAAALYLLSCNQSVFDVADEHITSSGIAFKAILKTPAYSYDNNAYKDLVRLAASLFTCKPIPDLDMSAIGCGGSSIADHACTALAIYAHGPKGYLPEESIT